MKVLVLLLFHLDRLSSMTAELVTRNSHIHINTRTQREEKFHFDNDVVVNAMCKHKIILEQEDKKQSSLLLVKIIIFVRIKSATNN